MGRGYVIDHCIAASHARFRENRYRSYITDALKAISENTSKKEIHGIGVVEIGTVMTKRWIEMDEPRQEEPEDPRSASEIVNEMWKRIRGEQV